MLGTTPPSLCSRDRGDEHLGDGVVAVRPCQHAFPKLMSSSEAAGAEQQQVGAYTELCQCNWLSILTTKHTAAVS